MTYQMREHGPWIDGALRRALQRRSIELVGVGLLTLCVALSVTLITYAPHDVGLLSTGSASTINGLGVWGAKIASALMLTVGLAGWGIAACLAAWSVRLVLHIGAQRLVRRALYAPLMIALGSMFLATLPRFETWPHHFGLGGMFGDTAFAALIYLWPSDAVAALSVTIAIIACGLSFHACGFTLGELYALLRRLPAPGSGRARRPDSAEPTIEPIGADEDDGHTTLLDAADDDDPIVKRRSPRVRGWITGAVARRRSTPKTHRDAERAPSEPPLTRGSLKLPGFDEIVDHDGDAADEQDESKPLVQRPAVRKSRPSRKAKVEARPGLLPPEPTDAYDGPPLGLLQEPTDRVTRNQSATALEQNAKMLEATLLDYGVKGSIESVRPGPVVTLYELAPAPGLKASRVIGLSDDIARSMSALSARISTVPGRSVIGIELPNTDQETVFLKELIAQSGFGDSKKKLPIALGKDIGGESIIVDLADMPHLLIAGTTGSGKSVAINTMILSLLYRLSPEECRLIMIDPKMLELSVYDGIPHLLAEVVTDPKKAVGALKWVVAEMEDRYAMMSRMGVRSLDAFNARIREAAAKGEPFTRDIQVGFDEETGDPMFETHEFGSEPLPLIVVIVDELADLMQTAGKEIEACIQRLAQMARASGIHMVLATQRPSVDVITGTIKANFRARVSFQVASKVDSRTILNVQGAEQLLGKGDMLFSTREGEATRVHGPFVSDDEVAEVVAFLKNLGEPEYIPAITQGLDGDQEASVDRSLMLDKDGNSSDAEYDMAVAIVMRDRKCSTSYIQRKLEIGYNKAARLVERMEEEQLVSPANRVGKREILVPE